MKMKKHYVIFVLIVNLVVLSFAGVSAFGKSGMPEYIKVGLFFNSSAKAVVNLNATTDILVGTYEGIKFNELKNLNHNNIFLRKDSYYIGSNGNYVEYTGDINSSGNLNIQGPFHVQIGNSFNTKEQAAEFMDSLDVVNDLYLAREGDWKVFAGLFISKEQAQSAGEAIEASTGSSTIVQNPSSTRIQVLNSSDKVIFVFDSKEDIYFKTNSTISVDGRNYRGSITVLRQNNSDMTVMNYLPVEEYLYGVVPREMPASWPLEALKAQAVAARSFALGAYNKFSHLGFNVCNTVNSQVYGGYDGEHSNSNDAVDETRGRYITHNGKIIDAYYHSNSGGHTEDSENIWSAVVPYIRGVSDDFSLDSPNSSWQAEFSREEIKNILEKNNISIGEVKDIVVTSRSINGRIMSLEVIGTNGKEVMEKQRSRTIFGLRSSWFDVLSDVPVSLSVKTELNSAPINLEGKHVITSSGVSKLNNLNNTRVYNGQQYKEVMIQNPQADFVFSGRGFGHGLGMSQHGARRMAELNHNYIDIIKHYYTGVEVE